MNIVGAFLVGAFVSSTLLTWFRGRWFTTTAGKCPCGREGVMVVLVVHRFPFAVDKAWGLCEWCAKGVEVSVRDDPPFYGTDN